MFEKEIKFIVDYTLNKLRKESAHLNMGRLLNSSIHPAIIKYCTAEIDSQIRKDREKMLHESFFDYSGSEVAKYLNLIGEEIRNNYKMKGEDLKKLIIKSVSFNANYVVRPGWTLAKFIFNEEKEKTIKEVLNYFNYVFYYDYQIQVLSAFIQKRKTRTLSQDEFVMITSKIDKEVIASNRQGILKDGVTSIADFFNEGGINKDKAAPYLIEYYLKDKKYNEAAGILSTAYAADDKQKYPIRDIVATLSEGLKEEIELPERARTAEREEHPDYTTDSVESQEEDNNTVPVHQESEDYQHSLSDLLKKSEEMKVSTTESRSNGNSSIDEEELTSLHETESEDEPKKPENFAFKYYIREEDKKEPEETTIQSIGMYNLHQKNDIFNFLSKKEIDRIVETVFNEDQNEFAATMDKLTECRIMKKHQVYLRRHFRLTKSILILKMLLCLPLQ
jgi:hypothetical protein